MLTIFCPNFNLNYCKHKYPPNKSTSNFGNMIQAKTSMILNQIQKNILINSNLTILSQSQSYKSISFCIILPRKFKACSSVRSFESSMENGRTSLPSSSQSTMWMRLCRLCSSSLPPAYHPSCR